jgi:hypothetical protein
MTVSAAAPPPKIFINIGMPRTGTTYLYHALPKHPEIFVPYRKESHYFSVNYSKGEPWFRALFAGMGPRQIGADINPMYFLDALAVDRILAYDAGVKVVLGVREPVDFAISLYGNMRAHGLDVPPVEDMVRGYDWPVTPHTSLPFSLVAGFMQRRITELQQRFAGRLLIYDFRHFDASPLPVLQAIERFLGLTPFFDAENVDNTRINATGRRNPLRLNALLANQRVLELVYACLPRPAIRMARSWFERFSARPAVPGTQDPPVNDATRDRLATLLADDVAYYRARFATAPILLPGADDAAMPRAAVT